MPSTLVRGSAMRLGAVAARKGPQNLEICPAKSGNSAWVAGCRCVIEKSGQGLPESVPESAESGQKSVPKSAESAQENI